MKTSLIPAAIALSLVAGAAMAQTTTAGADGPSFPSMQPAQGAQLTRAQVEAELAAARAQQGPFYMLGGGKVDMAPQAFVSTRTRAEVASEVAAAPRAWHNPMLAPDADEAFAPAAPSRFAQGRANKL